MRKLVWFSMLFLAVTGISAAAVNVALDAVPSYSDTAYGPGWTPEKAIDDDTGTGYHSPGGGGEHWYELDLQGVHYLESVELVNRGGYLGRLNGAYLEVMDPDRNVIYTSDLIATAPATAVWNNDGAGFGPVGFIKIVHTDTGDPLTIMELRAWAVGAENISPADGAVGILIDKDDTSELSPTLEWGLNDIVDAGAVTGYFLYFGTDEAAVSDAEIGDESMIGDTYMTATMYQQQSDLTKDTTYFWRVDTRLQDDPNSLKGDVWSFTSELTLPQITVQPADQSGLPGSDIVIAIEAVDPLEGDLTYQWIYDPNMTVEGDEVILDGNGADTAELTVPAIDADDAGYYTCEVTNASGTIVSDAAQLKVGNLVAHWPFDGSAVEVITGTECIEMGDPTYGEAIIGDTAIELDGDDYVSVPIEALAGMSQDELTISMWINTANFAGQNGFGFHYNNDGSYSRIVHAHLPWSSGTIYFDANDDTGRDRVQTGAGWIRDAQWHHIVFTKNVKAGIMRVYVDGGQIGQSTGQIRPIGTELITDAVIGAHIANGTGGTIENLFNGKIDDMRIYDIALDIYDVAGMYYDVTGEFGCEEAIASDLNGDCAVTLADLAFMAAEWLECNRIPAEACD